MGQEIVLGIVLKADGSGLKGEIAGVSQEIRQQEPLWKSMAASMGLVNAATMLLQSGMAKLRQVTDFVRDSVQDAARYQTLGVAMQQVGRNAGYTAEQMLGFETGLQRQGIAMLESRQTLTQMASAHIDLAKSSQLARIAQDAAVIGNINSSEAFGRMIHGIQSGQVEILRTIGITVNFEAAYAKLAQRLGINAALLTENEKAQARANAVIEYGPRIAGAYEAAMGTAGKQLASMTRYVSDLSVKMGTGFLEAFTQKVFGQADAMKKLGQEMDKLLASGDVERWGHSLADGLNSGKDAAVSSAKAVWEHRTAIEALGAAYITFKVASHLGPWVASHLSATAASVQFYGAVASGSAVMLGGRAAAEMQARATMQTAAADLAAAEAAVAHARARVLATDGVVRIALAENMLTPALQREAAAHAAAAVASTAHAEALAATTISARTAAAAKTALAGTVAALGGPIGVIITLLGVGATAWMMFGDRGKSAMQKVNDEVERGIEIAKRYQKEAKFGTGDRGQLEASLDAVQSRIAVLSQSRGEGAAALLAAARKQEAELQAALDDAGQRSTQPQAQAGSVQSSGRFAQLASQYAPKPKLAETLAMLEREKAEELRIAGDSAEKRADIERTYQQTRKGIIEQMGSDAHRATMEHFEREAAAQKRNADVRLAGVETSHKLGLLNDREYIDAKLAVEMDYLAQSEAILARKALAAKDASEKEKVAAEQEALAGQKRMARLNAGFDKQTLEADQRKNLGGWIAQQEQANEQLRLEAELLGKDALAVDQARAARESDLAVRGQIMEAYVDEAGQLAWRLKVLPEVAEGYLLAGEAAKEARLKAIGDKDAQSRDWTVGAKSALQSYLDEVQNTARQSDRAFTGLFRSLDDAGVAFARGQKVSFSSLADSFINDMIRMQWQASVTIPFAKAMKEAGGFGGMFSSLFGGGAPAASQGFGMAGDAGTLLGFAGGGDHGGGWRVVGERGPELEATGPSRIFTADQTRDILSGGGGNGAPQSIRVELINSGTQQKVTSAQPSFDMKVLVLRIFTEDIAQGGRASKQMESTYGLNRAAGAM